MPGATSGRQTNSAPASENAEPDRQVAEIGGERQPGRIDGVLDLLCEGATRPGFPSGNAQPETNAPAVLGGLRRDDDVVDDRIARRTDSQAAGGQLDIRRAEACAERIDLVGVVPAASG